MCLKAVAYENRQSNQKSTVQLNISAASNSLELLDKALKQLHIVIWLSLMKPLENMDDPKYAPAGLGRWFIKSEQNKRWNFSDRGYVYNGVHLLILKLVEETVEIYNISYPDDLRITYEVDKKTPKTEQ